MPGSWQGTHHQLSLQYSGQIPTWPFLVHFLTKPEASCNQEKGKKQLWNFGNLYQEVLLFPYNFFYMFIACLYCFFSLVVFSALQSCLKSTHYLPIIWQDHGDSAGFPPLNTSCAFYPFLSLLHRDAEKASFCSRLVRRLTAKWEKCGSKVVIKSLLRPVKHHCRPWPPIEFHYCSLNSPCYC